MPLVQELQNKIGKDKLSVLLLSIDEEWNSPQEAAEGMKRALKERNLDIPCAVAPGGGADPKAKFGFDGYGIALIGPDGSLLGSNLRLGEAEDLLTSGS